MELGDGPIDSLLKQLFPFDKTNLSLWRFSHFLALAYAVIYFVRPENSFFRSTAAWPVILCGQHSLHIFCLGVFLSFAGLIAIVEVDNSVPFQIVVNLVGILAMIATALVLAWYKAKENAPRRPAANPSVTNHQVTNQEVTNQQVTSQTMANTPVAKKQALGGSSAE
jgi:hypothetical protein